MKNSESIDLFKKLKIHTSDTVIKELKKEEAREFVKNTQEYIFVASDFIRDRYVPEVHRENFVVDGYLSQIVGESAYIELSTKHSLHDLDGGPSAAKKSAAIATWINRHKPLKFTIDFENDVVAFANSLAAYYTGLTIKLDEDGRDLSNISEFLEENIHTPQFLYDLMWRSPDYRQLTTVFSLIGSRI